MADDLGMAKAPFGPKPNAFDDPAAQLAFPAASINPGKIGLAGSLQKAAQMRQLAMYLNRPQQSQMGLIAPNAPAT